MAVICDLPEYWSLCHSTLFETRCCTIITNWKIMICRICACVSCTYLNSVPRHLCCPSFLKSSDLQFHLCINSHHADTMWQYKLLSWTHWTLFGFFCFAELSDVWSISSVTVRPDLRSMPTSPSTPHLPTITEEWEGGRLKKEGASQERTDKRWKKSLLRVWWRPVKLSDLKLLLFNYCCL